MIIIWHYFFIPYSNFIIFEQPYTYETKVTFTTRYSPTIKDLGIAVTERLIWTEYINTLKSKAFRKCHHILRSFHSNNLWTLLNAYTTFVRPTLEYSSIVWNPYLVQEVRSLERVQRFFTRRILQRCRIQYNSYAHRLYMLNIKSLEYRRLETDLIMVYKLIHNLVDIDMHTFFDFYSSPYNTKSHKYCLTTKRCKTKMQQQCFGGRVAKVWNKLPAFVVESPSIAIFRRRLKKFDLNGIADLVGT